MDNKPLFDGGPICFGTRPDLIDSQGADCAGCSVRQACNHTTVACPESFDEQRADVIGQNGNTGEHYAAAPPKPSDKYRARLTANASDFDGIVTEILAEVDRPDFQQRVQPWMLACFGAAISADTTERNHRFLEEALELVQATGCTASEAHQLVDYVFGRPVGDVHQEVGGVMVTLAALCLAAGEDMHTNGEKELARIWTKVDQIRAKQAAKPRHSPLPGPTEGRQ